MTPVNLVAEFRFFISYLSFRWPPLLVIVRELNDDAQIHSGSDGLSPKSNLGFIAKSQDTPKPCAL